MLALQTFQCLYKQLHLDHDKLYLDYRNGFEVPILQVWCPIIYRHRYRWDKHICEKLLCQQHSSFYLQKLLLQFVDFFLHLWKWFLLYEFYLKHKCHIQLLRFSLLYIFLFTSMSLNSFLYYLIQKPACPMPSHNKIWSADPS